MASPFPVTLPTILFGWLEPITTLFAALFALVLPLKFFEMHYSILPPPEVDQIVTIFWARSYGCILCTLCAINFCVFSGAIVYVPLMLKKIVLGVKLVSDYLHCFTWCTPLVAKAPPQTSWNKPGVALNLGCSVLLAAVRIAYLAGAWDSVESWGVVNGSRSWLCLS